MQSVGLYFDFLLVLTSPLADLREFFFFFCTKWVEEILLSLHIQDNL